MNTHNLGDLRAAIEDIVRSIMEESESGEAPNQEVLARLKSERRSLINFFTPQLLDIALTKLLVVVIGKGEEGDLFGGYGRIPKRVTVVRGLKKDTANLSISEAREWLERHSNRMVESDNKDFRKLVEECERHAQSDDDTIADILLRMREYQRGEAEELLPAE